MYDQQPTNTLRVRTTFSKTLKGGWSDETTIEMIVPADAEWRPQFVSVLDQMHEITSAEIAARNSRDNHDGGQA